MIAAVRSRTSPATTLKERLLHLKAGEYDGTWVERRAKILILPYSVVVRALVVGKPVLSLSRRLKQDHLNDVDVQSEPAPL